MNESNTTALVPISAAARTDEKAGGCGGQRSLLAGRSKWFLVAAGLLAVAALVLGSAVLGFAAILPLLFILPCLVMAAMCMKGHGKAGSSESGNAS